MSEPLTFKNFSPMEHGREAIYKIGASDVNPIGVGPEMAAAFNYDLTPEADVENLGGLIAKVGPAKELQENIAGVQEVLGTTEDSVTIARGWAQRSGLLLPVERLFTTAEEAKGDIYQALVTGGVRNWMERRADRAITLSETRSVKGILLVAGNRQMKPAEGPNVEEGMTEADYMHDFIVPRLQSHSIETEFLRVPYGDGNEVMAAAAAKTRDIVGLNIGRIAVVSNAGAWVQTAGQYLRAAKNLDPEFNMQDDQLEVVSDSFLLGTGVEPNATHQNPFSAAGSIVRNLQEFTRHVA